MKKIEQYFKRHNIDYDLNYNPHTNIYTLVTFDVPPIFNIKGVKVLHFNPYINTAQYITEEDNEILEQYNNYQFVLVNLFYKVRTDGIKAGKADPAATQDAVKAQYEYATKHNCINVFNNIYQ